MVASDVTRTGLPSAKEAVMTWKTLPSSVI